MTRILTGKKLKKRRDKNAASAKRSREKHIEIFKEMKERVTKLEAQNTFLLLELAHATEMRSACTRACYFVN